MWAITKKEFKTMFYSPIGYVIVAMFLIVYSSIFYITAIANGSVDLSSTYYGVAVYVLPFMVSLLTMKSFSEERSKGTEQLLEISPRSIFSIVMGKFFALLGVIIITLIISFMYFFVLLKFGKPDIKMVLTSMLGFTLLSMSYISFGIMISCLTENQIISAIITVVFFIVTPIASTMMTSSTSSFVVVNLIQKIIGSFISNFALIQFCQKFSMSIISFEEIIRFLSFTVMCIVLTILIIQKRKCLK